MSKHFLTCAVDSSVTGNCLASWLLASVFLCLAISKEQNKIQSKDKEASTTTGCEDSEPKAKKAKKERAFKGAWKKEFEWLMYDDESGKMLCQYGLHFPNSKNKQSLFCRGSQNFQLDGLRSHERSAGHVFSEEGKVARSKGTRKGTITAALLRLEKDSVAKMEKLFKMSFSSSPHLQSLQTKKWTYVRTNI